MANVTQRDWRRKIFPVLAAVVLLAGCSGYNGGNTSEVPTSSHFKGPAGYLTTETTPNSLAILPPPPSAGSAALALDEEISRKSFTLRDTPRWTLAISDADLDFPHTANTYSCALNVSISEQETPRVYQLLQRSKADLGRSTAAAKNHYQRARPFMVNNNPLCTPNDKEYLEKNGSYPSGHTTIGWGWALILAEVSPEQADAILTRGLTYGESRNVCNAHWHSDVVQGRVLASGVVARMHADTTFRADLEAAKVELAAARNKSVKPTGDCSAEAAALAVQPSLAQ